MENNNNDNIKKRYFFNRLKKEDTNPHARDIAQRFIDDFEEKKKKSSGITVEDLKKEEVMTEEKTRLNTYNNNNTHRDQVEIWGNTKCNTLMGQFGTLDGDIRNEIVTSPTPPEITNKVEYKESFFYLAGRGVYNLPAEGSATVKPSSEVNKPSEENNPAKRVHFEDDTISSIYDLAGDE